VNLRALANRATTLINPNVPGTVLINSAYTTSASGKREPSYAAPVAITVQMQALTVKEIEHLDALSIAGSDCAAYVNRTLSGIDRVTGNGGDLIQFEAGPGVPAELAGTDWRVTAVLEGWSLGKWCRVALTRQKRT
jgi:hypothetical protein